MPHELIYISIGMDEICPIFIVLKKVKCMNYQLQ